MSKCLGSRQGQVSSQALLVLIRDQQFCDQQMLGFIKHLLIFDEHKQ
jgi:hypothetical protein